ncbi:MAG: DUF1826 domain-containing protein [Porticoccaceae bacterium]|nr:DUF1826 domain-containing protein [Porticoccaceae bacterium]
MRMLAKEIGAPSPPQQGAVNCAMDTSTDVWPAIYQPETNIVVWRRQLPGRIHSYANRLLEQHPFRCQMTISHEDVACHLSRLFLEHPGSNELAEDIALLADMFSCLFETERVGLRLATLDSAMCPRFHVDHVPCRLVTTYSGSGTEWLNNEHVDRSRLGRGSVDSNGNRLEPFSHEQCICRAGVGDVVLLKGEKWEGNEGNGLVHRSPAASPDSRRLVLTLDFA